MSEEVKRKRGRPRKHPSELVMNNRCLTFRTRNGMRERLIEAAHKAGRSISEEIEWRLERSFERERLAQDLREIIGPQHRYAPHHHSPGVS